MLFQILYYSYYLNYGMYFVGSYYLCSYINLSHDIYKKFSNNKNPEILCLMNNLDSEYSDWIIIDEI